MRSQGDGELVQHRKTDQNKEDVEEGEDEEYGVRRSVKKLDPREPSKEEREEHEKTNLPFRNWCRHCVRGRGKEEACRDAKRDQEVAEVHLDFMFMGDEGDDRTSGGAGGEGQEQRYGDVDGVAAEEQRAMALQARHGVHEGGWL